MPIDNPSDLAAKYPTELVITRDFISGFQDSTDVAVAFGNVATAIARLEALQRGVEFRWE